MRYMRSLVRYIRSPIRSLNRSVTIKFILDQTHVLSTLNCKQTQLQSNSFSIQLIFYQTHFWSNLFAIKLIFDPTYFLSNSFLVKLICDQTHLRSNSIANKLICDQTQLQSNSIAIKLNRIPTVETIKELYMQYKFSESTKITYYLPIYIKLYLGFETLNQLYLKKKQTNLQNVTLSGQFRHRF